ncbi:hypothetical protein P7C71_g4814, partial [Lecanoromycetidae sp. Uapishka_2]
MAAQSSKANIKEDSGYTIADNGQPEHSVKQGTPEQTDLSKGSEKLPGADPPQSGLRGPVTGEAQPDVASSTLVDHHHQQTDLTGLDMPSRDKPNLSGNPNAAFSDAVKRGRSFVLPGKDGEKPPTTGSTIKPKATAKSPPPRSREKLLSKGDVQNDMTEKIGGESDADDDREENGALGSDEDEAQNESSDDEVSLSGQLRGRTGRAVTPMRHDTDSSVATVPTSDGEKAASTSKQFHKSIRPTTNYEQKVSARLDHEPHTSDSEEEENIRKAQKLPIIAHPINTSKAHRTSQLILRGDFALKEREAQEQCKRLRTYLVATDLSDEAAYALEWAIGTILRDGDTLIAVYALNEEVTLGKIADSLPVGGGAKAIEEDTAEMEKTTADSLKRSLKILKVLPSSSRKSSTNRSAETGISSTAEEARRFAIAQLRDTCEGFLRKTGLQVRILLEVIHCKDPSRMLMECIDGLAPLLVIVGSRGRTKLKGTLLGSFSNYVVSKSSAPVMVARKRVTGPKTNVALSNNLTTTRKISAVPTPKTTANAGVSDTKTNKSPSRSRSPASGKPLIPFFNKKTQGAKIDKPLNRSRSPRGKKT